MSDQPEILFRRIADYEKAITSTSEDLSEEEEGIWTDKERAVAVSELGALAIFDIANSLRIWQYGIRPWLEPVPDSGSDVDSGSDAANRINRRVGCMEECQRTLVDLASDLDDDERSAVAAELHALSASDIANTLRFWLRRKK